MTAPNDPASVPTPAELRHDAGLLREAAARTERDDPSFAAGITETADLLDAAAARIEELIDENRVQLAAIADLQVGCANDHAVIVGLRAERDAALAQLALARPIAEAFLEWVKECGQCECCDYNGDDDAPVHAADCPVPAWIAGRNVE